MNTLRRLASIFCASLLLCAGSPAIRAQAGPADAAAPAAASQDEDSEARAAPGWDDARGMRHRRDLVMIFGSSTLPAGERAHSVISIFGSSTSAGAAVEVVSVFGDTRVTGPVAHTAVAVVGNVYVDSAVDGDVVAVLGNVELGPDAEIAGDVVSVGGKVLRDPHAAVQGSVRTVIGAFAGFGWFRPWIDKCLLYARPLAFAPGLGWAWGVALALLALYAAIAVLFREGVARCLRTLETQPGMTLAAALLTVLLVPVVLVVLCVTLVGIAAVPFVAVALLCASLFGKAVMLAWLGERILAVRGAAVPGHPALGVLVGGAVVLALYAVPVLGFCVYDLLALFALGTVVHTLVLLARERRAGQVPPAPGVGSAAFAVPGTGAASGSGGTPASGAAPGSGPAPGSGAAPGSGPAPGSGAAAMPAMATLPRAGFWIRMAALLVDALLVGVVMGVLEEAGHLHVVMLALYGAIMWKLRGSTVGGIVFDLRVVRLDERSIDWETAIVRALGCFLSLFVAGLGFFWIALDPGKQAWHDKIAGTAVVRLPSAVAPA